MTPVTGDAGVVRRTLSSAAAGLLGAAPHVLHHAGPLAGTALVAGAGGKLLFGVIGFAMLAPMLLKMHRRTRSWRGPLAALAVFAAIFSLSTFVIGPAITGNNAATNTTPAEREPGPTGPSGPSGPSSHSVHHK
ncbi:MAG: hypothetical protein WAO61_08090 [Solirubrobacterales bacterium]